MGILAIDNEYEFIVTWKCNWKCEYCSVDTHSRNKIYFKEITKKIHKVPNGSYVTLSGGEVGSLSLEHVEYLIKAFNKKQCTLGLNTNGLFLERYTDKIQCFDTIVYHCTENMEDRIKEYDYSNIDYMVVVTDNNYKNLDNFLNVHPHITFSLVAATNPLGMNGPILSNNLKHEMVTKYYKRMTKQSIQRIFKEKDFDSIVYI